jgi:hypothetical protein
MAVAGAMTTAYKLRLVDGKLDTQNITYPSDKCVAPVDAAGKLRSGKAVIVQGSDMAKFWEVWNALA